MSFLTKNLLFNQQPTFLPQQLSSSSSLQFVAIPSFLSPLSFSVLLQSPVSWLPPLFKPWPSGFCPCFPLKPPRYISLFLWIAQSRDLLYLTGTFWRHFAQLALCSLERLSSVGFVAVFPSGSSTSLTLFFFLSPQTPLPSVPFKHRCWGIEKYGCVCFPSKALQELRYSICLVTLTFPLDHSYSSFESLLGHFWKPPLSP